MAVVEHLLTDDLGFDSPCAAQLTDDAAHPRRPAPENVFAAIPFGGGRHKCIGNAFALLQVRTIFTWLLHFYEFELAQPPEYYREVMPTLILRPSDPCRT